MRKGAENLEEVLPINGIDVQINDDQLVNISEDFPYDWIIQRLEELKTTSNLDASKVIYEPKSHFGQFADDKELSEFEVGAVILSFTATFSPEILAPLKKFLSEVGADRFGGAIDRKTGLYRPTLRTVIMMVAGYNPQLKAEIIDSLTPKSSIFSLGIVKMGTVLEASYLDAPLIFNDHFLNTILLGKEPNLDGEAGFPVRRSKSKHTLEQIIVKEPTKLELDKLQRFARNMTKLWRLDGSERVRGNYLSVFSGDPGTGKSFAAEAIGNELGLPVYKVNFAQLVSKYIGETEKNLEAVFNRFHGQPSILFFDEAESIFSKRTEVKDSHDQYANNLQSYLLQKVEDYLGIVILATNVRDLTQYFDKAFQRRIRSIVAFEFPDYQERLPLWGNSLFEPFNYEKGLPEKLAQGYQFSGGSIYNIASEAVIEALDRDATIITFEMLEQAMRDEFKKTGRKYEVCPDELVKVNPVRRFGVGYEKRRNF